MSAQRDDHARTPTGGAPAVSVIVPTRDRLGLLRRALTSIEGQRYAGEIEMVVVFDQQDPIDPGVPVGAGRTISVIANQRTPGLAGARNSGIMAARGELVAQCDDDDEWLPDKLRLQVERLQASPDAEVVVTGVSIVHDGKSIDRVPKTAIVRFDQLLRSRLQEIHPSSIVVRRRALIDGIGLVDEDLPGSYGEDYDWLLRASRRTPILVVQDPLVRAYWHELSFFADRWSTIADAISYLLEKFPEFQRDPRGLARLYGQLAFANAAKGDRAAARSWARRTLRVNPRERRAYLAIGVSTGLVSADTVMRLAHKAGRGI